MTVSYRHSSLHQAVKSGDVNAVKTILANGADVNAPNDAGQTPLIVAIVAGQHQLLRPLLRAGANPALRDNTGLTASEWAQRKGETELAQSLAAHSQSQANDPQPDTNRLTAKYKSSLPQVEDAPRMPLSAEEKTRRFIAGLKRQLDQKASREVISRPVDLEEPGPIAEAVPPSELISDTPRVEQPAREQVTRESFRKAATPPVPTAPEIVTEADADAAKESSRVTSPLLRQSSGPSRRKRCPQCGTVYNSELLAYCAYDAVALVDADQPIVTPRPPDTSPLLWVMIVVVMVLGAIAGLFVTNRFLRNGDADSQTVAVPQPPPPQKGTPSLKRQLVGKELLVPEAEVPANTVKEPTSVSVKVRVDRTGRVSSAVSEDGDQVLRAAAIEAAKKATFSVEKLRRRGAEGTITYTFK